MKPTTTTTTLTTPTHIRIHIHPSTHPPPRPTPRLQQVPPHALQPPRPPHHAADAPHREVPGVGGGVGGVYCWVRGLVWMCVWVGVYRVRWLPWVEGDLSVSRRLPLMFVSGYWRRSITHTCVHHNQHTNTLHCTTLHCTAGHARLHRPRRPGEIFLSFDIDAAWTNQRTQEKMSIHPPTRMRVHTWIHMYVHTHAYTRTHTHTQKFVKPVLEEKVVHANGGLIVTRSVGSWLNGRYAGTDTRAPVCVCGGGGGRGIEAMCLTQCVHLCLFVSIYPCACTIHPQPPKLNPPPP